VAGLNKLCLKSLGDVGPSSENMGRKEQLAQDVREIKASLETTEQELRELEAALELDKSNAFLLQKYEGLSKKEQQQYDRLFKKKRQFREEINPWTGEIRPKSKISLVCVLRVIWRQPYYLVRAMQY